MHTWQQWDLLPFLHKAQGGGKVQEGRGDRCWGRGDYYFYQKVRSVRERIASGREITYLHRTSAEILQLWPVRDGTKLTFAALSKVVIVGSEITTSAESKKESVYTFVRRQSLLLLHGVPEEESEQLQPVSVGHRCSIDKRELASSDV